MDLNNNSIGYEERYLGDVNNFCVSIQLIVADQDTPKNFPVQIKDGETAVVLNIADNNDNNKTMSCLFTDFGDAAIFLEYYLTPCNNIADAILAYKNFLFSETAIHVKKYKS